MIGVYFSGTGNTKYCLEKFVSLYDANAETVALEAPSTLEKIAKHQDIIFAYPIYYSNLPKIVHDFIIENAKIWRKKRIFIITTMGLFSGDGTGVSARLFKKYGAHITGLFGQRLWFFRKTKEYSNKIHIDPNACIGCGKCVIVCPMKNLSLLPGL